MENERLESSTKVRGDWNDVDAAVEVAASKSEMALMEATTDAAGRRVCVLRTIRDETALLVIERGSDGSSSGESVMLALRARVGRFGNPEAEGRLLRHVTERLRELRGVDTEEIR